MTWLPGEPDRDARTTRTSLHAMAVLLAEIHEVRVAPMPRTFQSWAWPAKWVVPDWSDAPDTWRRAFDVLAAGDPPWEPCFLQRDFGPHNLLWTGDRITGVVDWVETSTGPAWLDVAHGATQPGRCGTGPRWPRASRRRTSRRPGVQPRALLGRDGRGRLPAAARRVECAFGERRRRRLEEHLARVLSELG